MSLTDYSKRKNAAYNEQPTFIADQQLLACERYA
jgi:hypothetical protein